MKKEKQIGARILNQELVVADGKMFFCLINHQASRFNGKS